MASFDGHCAPVAWQETVVPIAPNFQHVHLLPDWFQTTSLAYTKRGDVIHDEDGPLKAADFADARKKAAVNPAIHGGQPLKLTQRTGEFPGVNSVAGYR